MHPRPLRFLQRLLPVLAGLMLAVIVEAAAQPLQPPAGPDGDDDLPDLFGDLFAPLPVGPRPVALILPLTGPRAAPGLAVRDGFIAAHLAAGAPGDVEVRLYDETAGAANAYRAAVADGAGMVVGPLLKESVIELAGTPRELPVLALNYLPDEFMPPPSFWQFGLAPEDEAREVARRALALGQRRALVLAPDNEWGRRVVTAFHREYAAGSGTVVRTSWYHQTGGDITPAVREVLGPAANWRAPAAPVPTGAANPDEASGLATGPLFDADLLFLVANGSVARQVRPQLLFFRAGRLPVYSTSAIHEDGAAPDTDLNGIQFPDTPWTIAPDYRATAVREGLRRHGPAGALAVSRLYALGYDAYALVPWMRDGRMAGLAVSGVTGRLSVGFDGRIERRLSWAEIRQGLPAPLPADAFLPVAPSVLPAEPAEPAPAGSVLQVPWPDAGLSRVPALPTHSGGQTQAAHHPG